MSADIYSRLIEALPLLDEHRAELKTKRGFNDDTIARGRFRSSGPHVADAFKAIITGLPPADIWNTGMTDEKNELLPQWTQSGIIIPYIDEGRVVYLRKHMCGPDGVPLEIYKASTASHLIFTEGEYKAAAAAQLGFGCWGIPGITTFSGKNEERLIDSLKIAKVERVTVMFDNEIKDDPQYKNYKADATVRYETMIYAIIMAKLMEKAGLTVRIATLPDEWRVNGKIDIDGALAQGRTRADIERVVADAQVRGDYTKRLPRIGFSRLRKLLRSREQRSLVDATDGYYSATRKKESVKISNFTMRIVNDYVEQDERGVEHVSRRVVLTDETGDTHRSAMISADQMMSNDLFAKWCADQGRFLWSGAEQELKSIWAGEFAKDTGRPIYCPDHTGQVDGRDFYLLGNCVIDHAGQIHQYDENGIYWKDEYGWVPRSAGDTRPPTIELEETVDMYDFCNKLAISYGNQGVKQAIGWFIASLFSDEIFKKYRFFPILFLGGKRRSGKTTLANMLMCMAGKEGQVHTIGRETTANGIRQLMRYASNLPVCLDEYRNNRDTDDKQGTFRTIYDRSGAVKSTRWGDGTRSVKIRGTLMLCGEDRPIDPGLYSRLIDINISESARKPVYFSELEKQMPILSSFARQVMQKRSLLPELLSGIDKFAEILKEKNGVDVRTAKNYAIAAAGYWIFAVPDGQDDEAFKEWLYSSGREKVIEMEETSATQKFWEEVSVIRDDERDGFPDSWIHHIPEGIVIYFAGIYHKWAKSQKQLGKQEVFSERAMLRYMDDEGYLKKKSFSRWVDSHNRRCIMLDADKTPKSIKEILEVSEHGDDSKYREGRAAASGE